MELHELIRFVDQALSELGVAYFVTGSAVAIFFGEPRTTNDVDVVVELRSEHVDRVVAAFPPPDFYVSRDAVRDAVRRRSMFNVIHPASGLKIDFSVAGVSEFQRSQFTRVRKVVLPDDVEARFASPEDLILNKLLFFHEGRSDKHLRDIGGILRVSGDHLESDYIEYWADRLGVLEHWRAVCERVRDSESGNGGL